MEKCIIIFLIINYYSTKLCCSLPTPLTGMPRVWQGEPHIVISPQSQKVKVGHRVTLRCAAFGSPAPHYQWYRNGLPLQDKNSETFEVKSCCWSSNDNRLQSCFYERVMLCHETHSCGCGSSKRLACHINS